jgi:hypothetical protein
LKPDIRNPEMEFFRGIGTSKDKFPRLVPVLETNPKSFEIISQIMDHRTDFLTEANEIAFTVVGYGFSSHLYTLVVALWVHEVPKFFQELNVPTIRVCKSFLPSKPPTLPTTPIIRRYEPRIPEATGNHPSRDKALRMLYQNCSSTLEKLEKLFYYKKASQPVMFPANHRLTHGSNISLANSEAERGSVGVFLRPVGEPSSSSSSCCYLLTAGHALEEGANGHAVQCNSHYDILREISKILLSGDTFDQQDQELGTLFTQKVHDVAELYQHSIEVSENLWREDWALARLNEGRERRSSNGRWHRNAWEIYFVLNLEEEEAELDDGIGLSKALPGDTVIKFGATTGLSAGIVNANHVYHYASPKATEPTLMMLIFSKKEPLFCARGDSGGGVFKHEGTRLNWVGLLVGFDHSRGDCCEEMGLMVPADVILDQISAKTGKKWELVCA